MHAKNTSTLRFNERTINFGDINETCIWISDKIQWNFSKKRCRISGEQMMQAQQKLIVA